MASRIYIVTDTKIVGAVVMVKANSQSQAVNAIVGNRYTARAASASDVAEAFEAGIKLVDATVEPATIAGSQS